MNGKHLYHQRLRAVVNYIDSHLDADLSVSRLCRIANFSQYHFHRQFRHSFDIPVTQLVQLKRLTRASYQLITAPELSVTEIALQAGFANSESFTRAFKRTFKQTPTQFRQTPFTEQWREKTLLPQLGGTHIMQVTTVDFAETDIALLVHVGSPATRMQAVAKFIQWRRANGYTPENSATYNILYADPDTCAPGEYSFGVGGAVEKTVAENPQGVINAAIPAGRCAVLRHIGSSDNIEHSIRYLYRDWLPTSGEELRDFPCFLHRVVLPNRGSAAEEITDIYLPIQ